MMQRGLLLFVLLVIVCAGGRWVWEYTEAPSFLGVSTDEPSDVVLTGGTASLSGGTEEIVDTGSESTGQIDDTELPLDQDAGVDDGSQAGTTGVDQEVEEIIDLLEELIAESEKK